MINEQEFGKRLTECMKISGYTNTKLTEELNVSKNAVGNYKKGQIPNASILYNISQLLGTTVEYLLTGKKTNETISEEEKQIIDAYRKADLTEKNIIKKILNVPTTTQIKSSDLKIG